MILHVIMHGMCVKTNKKFKNVSSVINYVVLIGN
jgi:hypothetical protein